jgi:hypothetical protein
VTPHPIFAIEPTAGLEVLIAEEEESYGLKEFLQGINGMVSPG